jgi:hypothetical protein
MGADSIDNEDEQHKLLHKFEEVLLKLKYRKSCDAIQKPGLPGIGEPEKSMRQKLLELLKTQSSRKMPGISTTRSDG